MVRRRPYYFPYKQDISFESEEVRASGHAFIEARKDALLEYYREHFAEEYRYMLELYGDAVIPVLRNSLLHAKLAQLRLRNEGELILYVLEINQREQERKEREERQREEDRQYADRAQRDREREWEQNPRDKHAILRVFCATNEQFSFLVNDLEHGRHPDILAQVPERLRTILERRWDKGADDYVFKNIAAERRCSIEEVRDLYNTGVRNLLMLHTGEDMEGTTGDTASLEPNASVRTISRGTRLDYPPMTPAGDARRTWDGLDALNGSDLLDGSKYIGWHVREHGRFGSHPLHDDYGDEANP